MGIVYHVEATSFSGIFSKKKRKSLIFCSCQLILTDVLLTLFYNMGSKKSVFVVFI